MIRVIGASAFDLKAYQLPGPSRCTYACTLIHSDREPFQDSVPRVRVPVRDVISVSGGFHMKRISEDGLSLLASVFNLEVRQRCRQPSARQTLKATTCPALPGRPRAE